ncbi:type II secretion system secretin GspD [Steroidobacter sp. S1-65]|uniref:Type II secretion system secretin GspD n=1 Tax=Steroidobacter gossypii TaxID=2805490 RepID=A0ABS1WZM5_9GAMM|nr:type II secretion system secretin GspD [Steroidobacter gossypii]MBM0106409.1 type II secretion system secretin GspD [Steroidobacter gossypii]
MTISITPLAGKPASALSGKRSGILALTLTCLLTCMSASAQQPPAQQATITPAFRDAELTEIIDAVATITGKTFIVDPRVRAQVTIRSSTPMTPDAFYQTFLSILQVHGFIAVPSGDNIKILPDANARQIPGNDLPGSVNPDSDEVVTQVISVRNINAAQLVPVLRPLIPQNGHLVAYPASNMLIISDRANNISRIMRIVQRLDQAGDEEIEIVRLENASASEIVRVVNALSQGAQQQGEAPGMQAKLVADDRTNSVLISGEKGQRLRLKGLVMHLDTPLESGGDTQVRYLNYADAEQLAGKLKEQVTGITQAPAGAPGGAAGAAAPAAAQDRNTTIWADKQTNALVITAAPKMMRQIMQVVDKLDIRRAQVHLEAILVEITQQRAAELGVNWAIFSEEEGTTIPIGTFNQSVGGTSIGSLASAIINPDVLESGNVSLPTGLTLGAGLIEEGGLNFALLLRALRSDGSSNILQTPSITTLDNEEAEIKVAQEVPFITGQYTNTGTTNQGAVNPFQTIQREEVGNILKITPQINEGTAVQLKIEQENSDLTQGVQGAVDLITNKRTISTTVLVEDGGVIVLGGLISDSANEGEARVPILGSIPILGELFKTRNGNKTKRNLMVFIRPTILRDGVDAAIETNAKYNVLRNQQLQRKKGKVTLLPGERQPLLPPIEDLSKYADPTAGAEAPTPGTSREMPPPAETQPLPEQTPPPDQPRP